jgi:hypothetical protein
MASNLSRTEICNLALDYLDEAPMQDYDNESESSVVQWFRRNFDKMAASLMRQYTWNFAKARKILPALSDTPLFGYKYAYQIPTDCLRVLPITCNGEDLGDLIRYKIEGNNILTDQAAPLKLRYIKRFDETGQFDELFVDVLACALAQKLAHFLTGKTSYSQLLGQTLSAMIATAKRINAIETAPDPVRSDWLIEARSF